MMNACIIKLPRVEWQGVITTLDKGLCGITSEHYGDLCLYTDNSENLGEDDWALSDRVEFTRMLVSTWRSTLLCSVVYYHCVCLCCKVKKSKADWYLGGAFIQSDRPTTTV